MNRITVFWFRRDLRLHDNHGLYEALKSGFQVLPIFIYDTNILEKLSSRKDRRVDFINQAIAQMDLKLKRSGSSLQTYYGDPYSIFQDLVKQYDIAGVYTNEDYEPYATKRDEKISLLLSEHRIGFHRFKDQVIFSKNEISKANGEFFKIFTPYSKRWLATLNESHLQSYPSETRADAYLKFTSTPLSLEKAGFEKTDLTLRSFDFKSASISSYDEYRNRPSLSTTHIGPHLRFGTVSVREAITASAENEVWRKELIWREFFMMILWNDPSVVNEPFNKKFRNMRWETDESMFQKWAKGETGYAFVDAGMRELNESGFIHNRARMAAASFLCKHLLIDYRWGEAYFAEKLNDFELASNNGNWQWVAGTGCDAAPYFRIFNPDEQQKKFDPDFSYIKKWIPEFGTDAYPKKIIEHRSARERALQRFRECLS